MKENVRNVSEKQEYMRLNSVNSKNSMGFHRFVWVKKLAQKNNDRWLILYVSDDSTG